MKLSDELVERVKLLARVPSLLVATDYDGTLAPLVTDPTTAGPLRESSVALRSLASLANTSVAIISGRALRDLAVLSRLPEEIHLVGSHGSEFDIGFVEDLTDAALDRLAVITERFAAIAEEFPGALIEEKPASSTLHYRGCDPAHHADIAARAEAAVADLDGVYRKPGKLVLEVMVVAHDKGNALDKLRHGSGAVAVIFLGDDVSDEDAFVRLAGLDLGIKVGEGESAAQFRVDSPVEVSEILGLLSESRTAWAMGEGFPDIESLGFLSNGQTTAIMTADARVNWLSHPRPDSESVFAELLGGAAAGAFAVYPAGSAGSSDPSVSSVSSLPTPELPTQRYLGDTMTIETAWPDLTVTDYLGRPLRELSTTPYGAVPPDHETVLYRVLTGSGKAIIEFNPRPDFGRYIPSVEIMDDGIGVSGGVTYLALRSPGVSWQLRSDGTAIGEIDLTLDAPVTLELRLGTHNLQAGIPKPEVVRARTETYWRDWAARLNLPARWPAEVKRSALTLKGLCYEPTGAVLAAATTSLPEGVGGVRNWDYRFCWPRDAAMSASALAALGSFGEGLDFLRWVKRHADDLTGQDLLRPLYPVEGNLIPTEASITDLSGYRSSRPVRIGNAATHQAQHDVFGSILDLMWQLAQADEVAQAVLTGEEMWTLTGALVRSAAGIWNNPDNGVWEARLPARHHTQSKVMCWAALDRGVRLGELRQANLGPGSVDAAELTRWRQLADTIAQDIFDHGWNDKVGAYTVAYGDRHLDASILWLGLLGLAAPDDERFISTVNAVESQLRYDEAVYRYRFHDGLPGHEGGFFICAFWLVEALHLIGQPDRAEELLELNLAQLGQLGLMGEQFDPIERCHLGNFPQAYSHTGLINAVVRLYGFDGAGGPR